MPTAIRSDKNLVWMDLEMTGLDPAKDVILQAALIITDENLRPLAHYSADIFQPESALATMSPFVRDMHESTGLTARVRASKTELFRAEQAILKLVSEHCSFGAVLCGNTIHSDRKFVDKYMPALAGYLHYRMVDVSSLKVLASLWLPSEKRYAKPEQGKHDAIFDVEQSIAELRHYRKVFMNLPEGIAAKLA